MLISTYLRESALAKIAELDQQILSALLEGNVKESVIDELRLLRDLGLDLIQGKPLSQRQQEMFSNQLSVENNLNLDLAALKARIESEVSAADSSNFAPGSSQQPDLSEIKRKLQTLRSEKNSEREETNDIEIGRKPGL